MAQQQRPTEKRAALAAATRRKKAAEARKNLLIASALVLVALGLIITIIVLLIKGGSEPSGESSGEPSLPASSEVFSESSEPGESSVPEVSELSELELSEDPTPKYEYSYLIDIADYESYIEPADPMEYVFLVNPTHTLASDFVPADLVDCVHTRKDGRKMQQLRLYAEKALEAFLAEGKASGVVSNVTVTSAYRSYAYQHQLFEMYCEQHQHKFKTREECEAYVLTFSTKPGTSEHQSGLCLDMHNLGSAEQTFAKTKEAKWLAENCWKFGFILRYPADKEDITKIIYEPWHFRFVGRFAATEMHELNMCLEEYIAYKGLE